MVFSLQFTLEKTALNQSPNVAVLYVIKPFRFTIMYFTRVVLLHVRLITTCKYFRDNSFASINTRGLKHDGNHS